MFVAVIVTAIAIRKTSGRIIDVEGMQLVPRVTKQSLRKAAVAACSDILSGKL